MNEHISTSSPSYVNAYGMSREPFSEQIEDDLFYAEPTRKQKLDILLHLTQYGNELMLVTGPTDSGKTTLLQQFQLHALDTWKVARIEAKNGIDERKLVQQLFHQMGLEFHGATHTELLEHLEHHFDSLKHSARQAIMLIDDAEQLPVTALKCVLALAATTSKDNKPLLRIILFGLDKLEENFSDPLLNQYHNIVRRNVDLPAFDNEHTAHYILHRLSAANFSDNKPFTESAMHKIHKQSDGWPGKINQLSHNLLIECAPTKPPGEMGKTVSAFNISRAVAAVFGIGLISALLFFQDEFNSWINTDAENESSTTQQIPMANAPEAEIKDPQENIPVTKEMPAPVAINESSNTPDEEPAAILTKMYGEPTDELETTPTAPSPDAPVQTPSLATKTIAPKSNTKIVLAEPPVAVAAAPTPVTASVTTPVTTTIKTSTTTLAASTPAKPKTAAVLPAVISPTPPKALPKFNNIPTNLPGHREYWILKQNPEHYTLQLVAGNNIKTLRTFIKRHKLTKPLAVYQSTRKNKPWFGLVHGSFTSKQKAINARSQLSKALQQQKPWVRKLDALQKELR